MRSDTRIKTEPDVTDPASLVPTLFRFSAVGLVATGTYFVVANLFFALTSITHALASTLAYLVAMLVSFLGQSRITFLQEKTDAGHWVRFLLMSAIGLCSSYALVLLCTDVLRIAPVWGSLATCAVIPAASFFAMKLWVFAE